MFSKTGYILLISGLLVNTVIRWWLGYLWLDILGFGLIMASLLISKKEIIGTHQKYGIYIYYTLMVIFMIMIFVTWFMN